MEADLRLALGEPDRARRVLLELDPFDAAVGMARLQLAEGDPQGAVATIAAFLADDRDAVIPFARVEAHVLDAIAHDALRDESGALAALERALDMAEPRGCSMVVARYGAPLRSLVRRLLSNGTRHRALGEDLLKLVAREAAPEPAAVAPLLEPLSERELTVLRYLPTMMSNAEIAAEMYVSVNTVKTHLKHVYRKLDVADRRDCVRRGRELRLLSP
jgi:LuxR family transcriptional regulator, maltose regulon positive regulatory protein